MPRQIIFVQETRVGSPLFNQKREAACIFVCQISAIRIRIFVRNCNNNENILIYSLDLLYFLRNVMKSQGLEKAIIHIQTTLAINVMKLGR